MRRQPLDYSTRPRNVAAFLDREEASWRTDPTDLGGWANRASLMARHARALLARCQEAERDRDKYVQATDQQARRSEAAEARVAELEVALLAWWDGPLGRRHAEACVCSACTLTRAALQSGGSDRR